MKFVIKLYYTDETKDTFFEEIDKFDECPKHHMRILLSYFNTKEGREDNLNRKLGMKAYMKLEMILELE
jgi:hypothetical protein